MNLPFDPGRRSSRVDRSGRRGQARFIGFRNKRRGNGRSPSPPDDRTGVPAASVRDVQVLRLGRFSRQLGAIGIDGPRRP